MNQTHPIQTHRFFVYDPMDSNFIYFETIQERNLATSDIIASYCDGEWDEMVDQIVVGEVTGVVTQTNVVNRPTELDENECDIDGRHWPENISEYCDYELMPLVDSSTTI